MNKDCSICVYKVVCPSWRSMDTTVIDCCIPEEPLRKIQAKPYYDIQDWITKTHEYIKEHKMKSVYWQSQIG